jgi:hypothetical protein
MMVHVVLFTPRPGLADAELARLSTTLDQALREIPTVRRYHVGRRTRLGTAYDQAAPIDFNYCVLVEFDDRDGLVSYLHHPLHEALGRLFYETSADALASDFETVSADVGSTLAAWRRSPA